MVRQASPQLRRLFAGFPQRWSRFDSRSCGICGELSGAGAGFLRVLRFPLPILIPPTAPHWSSIVRGWYNRNLWPTYQVDSVSPHLKKTKREKDGPSPPYCNSIRNTLDERLLWHSTWRWSQSLGTQGHQILRPTSCRITLKVLCNGQMSTPDEAQQRITKQQVQCGGNLSGMKWVNV
jgi:hypothetical protein